MKKASIPSHRAGWVQRGFTLVELMISMVIGLLIVLALITLLINVNRNNSEMTRTNRVIENGRFALQLLQSDAIHAGFWGGFVPSYDDLSNVAVPTDVPTAIPDPCLTYSAANWTAAYQTNLIGIPVQAYEIPAVVPSPTTPVCASLTTNPKGNTDVLIVRHVEPCAAGVDPNCTAPTAADVYFQAPRCNTVASVNYSTSTYALGTTATTSATPLYQRDCLTRANPWKFVSNLYYVRSYAVTAGDGIPTLMRSQFENGAHSAPQAMIEGIEGFRVEFGIDNISDSGGAVTYTSAITWADPSVLTSPTNRGDGIPDTYVRCTVASPCTAAQLMNAVAAKIYVLVRSETKTPGYTDGKKYCLASTCTVAADYLGPFTDGYKRHLFTQTVRMVNVSSRRETPP